jgi:hypothetical protein
MQDTLEGQTSRYPCCLLRFEDSLREDKLMHATVRALLALVLFFSPAVIRAEESRGVFSADAHVALGA